MSDPVIDVTRYSDVSWPMIYRDESGDAIDLTGWSVAVAEATDSAAFVPAAAITDAVGGEITLAIPWDDDMPETILQVRLKLTMGALDDGLPRILVRYV